MGISRFRVQFLAVVDFVVFESRRLHKLVLNGSGSWIEVGKRSYLLVFIFLEQLGFLVEFISFFFGTAIGSMFTGLLAPFLKREPSAFFISWSA